MAQSLTHVSYWNNGWKRISVEEASKLYPDGMSADYQKFRCDLCCHYVLLTKKGAYDPYFKHSKGDEDKECDDRSHGYNTSYYTSTNRSLPIKLVITPAGHFALELGFLRIPEEIYQTPFSITVKATRNYPFSVNYLSERLSHGSTTYLALGAYPCSEYVIETSLSPSQISQYWPRRNAGVDPDGTCFDYTTGKMLPSDSDVVTNRWYYLLKRGSICSFSDIDVVQIHYQSVHGDIWFLYRVRATRFSPSAAVFFNDYHLNLSDAPVSLQPVWPLYNEDACMIKHNKKDLFMHVTGNDIDVRIYPDQSAKRFDWSIQDKKRVVKIDCTKGQQMISAGRAKILQYTYFWQDRMDKVGTVPYVSVTDTTGAPVETGYIGKMPVNGSLRIRSAYDAVIRITGKDRDEKIPLHSDKSIDIDGIVRDTLISVMVGLDIVWQAFFIKEDRQKKRTDTAVIESIINGKGKKIPVPHSLGNLINRFGDSPQMKDWLYRRIREGWMYEQSYRLLQQYVENEPAGKSRKEAP